MKPFGILMDDLPSGTSAAVRDVVEERVRQKVGEGWSAAHDDAHSDGQLAQAAAVYALPHEVRARSWFRITSLVGHLWPWDLAWFKPADRRRECVKAAALLLAEIERIDRAAAARVVPYFDPTDPTIPVEP